MRLECEGDSVLSDGDDLMFVNLSVLDAEGRVVPRAKNEVVFTVEGPAEIVATDNGDETDFDSFKSPSRRAFNGRLQAVLRAHPGASGLVTIRAESPGLAGAYAMFRVGGDLRPKARMGLSTPTGRKTETLNWRSARGGETHNMLVVHPKSAPAKPAPLFVALHGHGASIVGSALSRRPGTVCIMFGSNDAIHGRDMMHTKANLRAIVSAAKANGSKVVLAVPPRMSFGHAKFDHRVRFLAEHIRALAKEEGVRLVDFYKAFGEQPERYLNPEDGLHLSEEGGEFVAKKFNSRI